MGLALDNISIRDDDPPTLAVGNSRQTPSQLSGLWSGRLTLTFSENLYWLSNTADDRRTIKAVVGDSVGTNNSSMIGILDSISQPGYMWVTQPTGTDPDTTFYIEYQDIAVGDSITLFSEGLVCDQSGTYRNQIVLDYVNNVGTDTNGNPVPGFVIGSGRIEGDRDSQSGT